MSKTRQVCIFGHLKFGRVVTTSLRHTYRVLRAQYLAETRTSSKLVLIYGPICVVFVAQLSIFFLLISLFNERVVE